MSIGHLEALARERGMICDPELQRLRDRYSDLVNMHREDLVLLGEWRCHRSDIEIFCVC